jgi:large subunit ribosomal protein L21
MSELSAIIQLQGKQHLVTEGDVLEVDRLETEAGTKMDITDVLLTTNGTKTEVGAPLVKGAKVTVEVVEHGKGDKIRVFKYKSKSKYRKTNGHRQYQTTLKVVKIAA